MNRGLDKQSLFGILLTIVILGAAGWLLLANKNNDSATQKISDNNISSVDSVLRSPLESSLKTNTTGAYVFKTGSGMLTGKTKWAFSQSNINPELKIVNFKGQEVSSTDKTAGDGGKVTITGASSLADAQDALRRTLADDQVKLTQQNGVVAMASSQIVGQKPVFSPGSLVIAGLFLRSECKDQGLPGNEHLKQSCTATLSN